ncbi:glycosyltransferase family 4 protein [Butyrivibrio sp. LC3010]|uniref:glycosyltransferase family 4 protein n=1 Tax=Butyrivibrio sp. LC3010 TaxID=1280680 RepID=UPI0004174F96|nr:glycosyltransferase family 4 protein [Butyrivibrio sp. LC3010]
MRVLIFRTNGNIVNLKTYNLQEIGIAKALISKGIECDVMYYGGNAPTHEDIIQYEDSHIRVIWAKGFSIAGNGFFPNVGEILKEYDIIQVCEYDQLFSRYLAFFSKYKKRVCMTHGPYYNVTNRKYNLKIKLIDRLWIPRKAKENIWMFAKSNYAKEFLSERGFKKIAVTGVGLDIKRFDGNETAKKGKVVKDLEEFKQNDRLLLYIGQISERRNIIFLLNTFKELSKDIPNCKLAILGDGPEDYKEACKKEISKLGIEKSIYYAQKVPQDQVPLIYRMSDLFLLPTNYEIFGMVMLEAMFFGTPFLTTDNGGSATVIKDGENGFILPLDVERWCVTIKELLSNRDKAKAISMKAHETIVQDYTWDKIVNKMVDAYHQILLGLQ